MNTTDYESNNCGESTNVGGVPICRLAVVPCPMLYGNGECEKERAKRFMKALGEMIRGAE